MKSMPLWGYAGTLRSRMQFRMNTPFVSSHVPLLHDDSGDYIDLIIQDALSGGEFLTYCCRLGDDWKTFDRTATAFDNSNHPA